MNWTIKRYALKGERWHEQFHTFTIILTKTERDGWLGTIAHDLRFQRALQIRRTDFRTANVKQKVSASKKRYARYFLICDKSLAQSVQSFYTSS